MPSVIGPLPSRPSDSTRPIEDSKGRQKTRDAIESIRARNPVEQVIGRYVELQARGRLVVARCPFHDDADPSLVVYPQSQTWHCFGCDVGGDVFNFVERIERVRFGEALQRLESGMIRPARIARATNPPLVTQPEVELTVEHFTLLTAAVEVYHAAIFSQPSVLEYLAQRRIDMDDIRRHRIGYATGDELAKYLRFRGWNPEIAEELGLLGLRGGPRREFFRERIVIPEIRNNQVIYLVGRATQKYQKAKYLTLPGAAKPRYGLETIRGARDVFLVEGPFDMFTLVEWGYPTLALMGSHIKDELIDELAGAERIYIVTHPDEAGQRVARQLIETLGKRARIVPPLPHAKDVNELAGRPRAKEIFAALVQRAR